jgi:hypothetical protein
MEIKDQIFFLTGEAEFLPWAEGANLDRGPGFLHWLSNRLLKTLLSVIANEVKQSNS